MGAGAAGRWTERRPALKRARQRAGVFDPRHEPFDGFDHVASGERGRMALAGNGDGLETRMRAPHCGERVRREQIGVLPAQGQHRQML